ncbi:unnamed protein product [Durusdinium trenchii]|uniref:Uncharacterized protein n=2 Tax=Durusdinium trenchii TaxID=1381693 RepID=A0ABP0S4V2_9DINO
MRMMQAEEKARVRAETAKGLQIYIYIYTSGLSDVFCTVCSVSTSHLSLNYFHYQKAKMYNFPALKASVVGDPLRVLPTEEDISTQKSFTISPSEDLPPKLAQYATRIQCLWEVAKMVASWVVGRRLTALMGSHSSG